MATEQPSDDFTAAYLLRLKPETEQQRRSRKAKEAAATRAAKSPEQKACEALWAAGKKLTAVRRALTDSSLSEATVNRLVNRLASLQTSLKNMVKEIWGV